MKQVSLGGLDVSWLGLGAMGMSVFAENANRGDHALLLSPWRTSTIAQEFGDHPDTAARRMRWARQLIAQRPAAQRQEAGHERDE